MHVFITIYIFQDENTSLFDETSFMENEFYVCSAILNLV